MELQAFKINFKLKSPISISFHTWYYRENILIVLKHKDYQGLGEAAPFKPITGDSQEEVIEELIRLKSLPLNPEKDSLEKLHQFLNQKINSQTLKCALDFAYHDILGKIKKMPVYKLYREKPSFIYNSVTVFIKETPEKTAKEAKKIYKKYPHLRLLKIKLKGKGDIERVKAIKKVSPSQIKFVLDANQGFKDPKEAVEVLTRIRNILQDVILVEEPCPKGDLKKLKFVKEHLKKTLVFADESAATLEDAKKVIDKKAAHGINIKLQKAGGIWPGKQIAKLCQKAGFKIMVGSMMEGPVSITAGVHFAVSTPNLILTDLDMDLDMPKHTREESKFINGKRTVSLNSGLGVFYNFNRIKELKKRGLVIFEKIL